MMTLIACAGVMALFLVQAPAIAEPSASNLIRPGAKTYGAGRAGRATHTGVAQHRRGARHGGGGARRGRHGRRGHHGRRSYRRHYRGPSIYFGFPYYSPYYSSPYYGYPYYRRYAYPYRYRYRGPASRRCAYWSRRCIENWGPYNADYYGCMRYHRCRR